jgi:uncharacterized damage-inducible protein DinB
LISPGHARLMARYNRWQNESLYGAAGTLTDAARREDRGAFFGSIHGTLSHLMWGDGIWMHRFAGLSRPPGGIEDSPRLFSDWAAMATARKDLDAAIIRWAEGLGEKSLDGDLSWFAASTGLEMRKPLDLLVAHFFNHQTHHRGQIHAMLTAAGAKPGRTDLVFMPDEA